MYSCMHAKITREENKILEKICIPSRLLWEFNARTLVCLRRTWLPRVITTSRCSASFPLLWRCSFPRSGGLGRREPSELVSERGILRPQIDDLPLKAGDDPGGTTNGVADAKHCVIDQGVGSHPSLRDGQVLENPGNVLRAVDSAHVTEASRVVGREVIGEGAVPVADLLQAAAKSTRCMVRSARGGGVCGRVGGDGRHDSFCKKIKKIKKKGKI